MDNQEKIDNLITVVKTFARKFASIEEKIDTIEVKLDKFRVGIKEGILDRLDKVEEKLKQCDIKHEEAKPISRREFLGIDNPQTDKEVKPAMYKRITANLQELQSMFGADDTWEINFIQGILDFSGQTVTAKQYDILKQLAGRVQYKEALVIIR
jgi:hypothetical protein